MANAGSNRKTSNIKKVSIGKINTKKVFPSKNGKVKVEEISIDEALSSRVRRNQKLYNKSNEKRISDLKVDQDTIKIELHFTDFLFYAKQ